MHYFAHTLKGCGPLALALFLTACGEETANTSAATGQGLEGVDLIALETPQTSSQNLSQQVIVAEVSSPAVSTHTSARGTSIGATANNGSANSQTPNGIRSVSQIIALAASRSTSAPMAPTDSNLNKVELANGNSAITAPVQNARPEQSAISRPQPDREYRDELPVQPPIDVADGNDPGAEEARDASLDLPPVVGADPLVTLIAKTDSDLNSSGTRLVWNAENVDTCTASGAWEGDIRVSGELDLQHNEAGDQTYMIMCNGNAGTAMAMVTITVESTALVWVAPVQNTNGSQITDLAGYNLYYGTESGRYTQVRPVRDASQTNLELPVEPGTYYLAMTAYDLSGNESELSNEIIRTVY